VLFLKIILKKRLKLKNYPSLELVIGLERGMDSLDRAPALGVWTEGAAADVAGAVSCS
jgi:hypothetical protein